jgi:hypothetical protein
MLGKTTNIIYEHANQKYTNSENEEDSDYK